MSCKAAWCKTIKWDFPGTDEMGCLTCWSAKDMLQNYYRWDGRLTYKWEEIKDADPTNPWTYGQEVGALEYNFNTGNGKVKDNVCQLKCLGKTWSNYFMTDSSGNKSWADNNEQRCTSHNCKDWDSDAVMTIDTILDGWAADRGSGTAAEIVETMTENPINFELKYSSKIFTLKKLTLKANGGFLLNAEFTDPGDATVFEIRKESGWSNDRICLDFSASAQKNYSLDYNATKVQFDFATANFVQDSKNLFILINQGCQLTSKLSNNPDGAQIIHECKCLLPRTINKQPEYEIQDSATRLIHLPVTIDEFVYRDSPDRSENFYRSEPWVGNWGG